VGCPRRSSNSTSFSLPWARATRRGPRRLLSARLCEVSLRWSLILFLSCGPSNSSAPVRATARVTRDAGPPPASAWGCALVTGDCQCTLLGGLSVAQQAMYDLATCPSSTTWSPGDLTVSDTCCFQVESNGCTCFKNSDEQVCAGFTQPANAGLFTQVPSCP
jgi:hypothetical protein